MANMLDAYGMGALLGAFAGMMVFFVILFIAAYIYQAWATMVIAQKTKTKYPWLAWIPIANLFLLPMIAQVPWWTALIVVVASFIPFLGIVVVIAATIWWWWKISERRNYPGPLGILMVVPIAQWIVLGFLAWKEQKAAPVAAKPAAKK
ncbi:MAG: hypothetical protein ABIA93_02685 [Candidatus Woesearchaeota archaeon]